MSTPAEPWTIGRLLTWTTDYLKQHGAESPRLDAELLLAEAKGCQRIELYTSFNELAEEELRSRFRALVQRRANGEPVAYLLGCREFYSLDFHVSPAVLIPRPETEFLVIAMLDRAKEQGGTEKEWLFADVGTGSGILPVCLARELSHSRAMAIDISPAALTVARENAQRHEVSERIEFLEGDLLEGLPAEPSFDFIVSNPPYITTAEMAELPRDVAEHEPHGALEAGPQGTEIIGRLIPQSAERLKPGGWLLMEISPQILSSVELLLSDDGRWEAVSVTKDLARLPRVVAARRKA